MGYNRHKAHTQQSEAAPLEDVDALGGGKHYVQNTLFLLSVNKTQAAQAGPLAFGMIMLQLQLTEQIARWWQACQPDCAPIRYCFGSLVLPSPLGY